MGASANPQGPHSRVAVEKIPLPCLPSSCWSPAGGPHWMNPEGRGAHWCGPLQQVPRHRQDARVEEGLEGQLKIHSTCSHGKGLCKIFTWKVFMKYQIFEKQKYDPFFIKYIYHTYFVYTHTYTWKNACRTSTKVLIVVISRSWDNE